MNLNGMRFQNPCVKDNCKSPRGPLAWVGVVVHLFRDPKPSDLSEPQEEGFFPPDAGLRRPSRFPLGIPASIDEVTVSSEVIEAIGATD